MRKKKKRKKIHVRSDAMAHYLYTSWYMYMCTQSHAITLPDHSLVSAALYLLYLSDSLDYLLISS